MKKFAILTSLLALTACGGGSGGSVAPFAAPENLSIEDLSKMTMKTNNESEFVFNVKDGKIVSLTETDHDGETDVWNHTGDSSFALSNLHVYEVKDDDEIETLLAQHGVYNAHIITSVGSNKTMTPAKIKEELWNKNAAAFEANGIELDDDTIAEIQSAFDNLDFDHYYISDASLTLTSLGAKSGLSYSDFGYTTTKYHGSYNDENFGEIVDNSIYVGGIKDAEMAKPAEDMVFEGAAVAHLHHDDYEMITETEDAKLTVSSTGAEELSMKFANSANPWYNVVARHNELEIDFDSIDESKIKDERFVVEENNFQIDGFSSSGMNTVLYGDGEEVKEANSVVDFKILQDTNDIRFDAVFGGAKK